MIVSQQKTLTNNHYCFNPEKRNDSVFHYYLCRAEHGMGDQFMKGMIRVEFQFYGRVQGVGFRYKLNHLARSCGVSGWVRNEYDGSVSAQLQGRQEQLDQILPVLVRDRYIDIEDVHRKEIPLEEAEQGFQIRY